MAMAPMASESQSATPEPFQLRQLPNDALRLVVQAALRQAGSTVQAWVRLSLVCKAWQAALQGASGYLEISSTCLMALAFLLHRQSP